MTSATDTDIQQIKDLIAAGNAAMQKQIVDGNAATQKQIADGNAAMQKQIAELDKNIEVGFAKIDGELKEVTNRLVAVEASSKGLDARLWAFGASLAGLVATTLLGIFIRYLFAHDSII